jgi:hypothetical protein
MRHALAPRSAIRTTQVVAALGVLCSCVASRPHLERPLERAPARRQATLELPAPQTAQPPRPVVDAEEPPSSESSDAISVGPVECQDWRAAISAGGVDEVLAHFRWPECSRAASDGDRVPAFDSPVACYYGRSPYSRASVLQDQGSQRDPWILEPLRPWVVVLHASTDRVTLIQYGMHDYTMFERVLVLELRDQRWRIVAETDRPHMDCLSDTDRRLVEGAAPPRALLRCQRTDLRCERSCERHTYGSVPYSDCVGGCLWGLRACYDHASIVAGQAAPR